MELYHLLAMLNVVFAAYICFEMYFIRRGLRHPWSHIVGVIKRRFFTKK